LESIIENASFEMMAENSKELICLSKYDLNKLMEG